MNIPRRGTPDFVLLLLTVLLVCFGVLMVFSASSATAAYYFEDAWLFTKKQAMWAILGAFSMLTLMNMHYSKLKRWTPIFFLGVVGMLLLVPIIGEEVNGAKRWFSIGPFGGQPTEFAKLGLILMLAAMISKKGEKIRDFSKGLLPAMLVTALIGGLIMLQPDLGSTILITICAFIVIMAGGASIKHLLAVGGIGVSLCSLAIGLYLAGADQYNWRMNRIQAFLNPWEGDNPSTHSYQLIQSLYAFGHGGLTGTGFGQSVQKLHYLPYAYNDFIFAIIGEELGFIGSIVFLLVYLLFLWRGLIVALRCPDLYGTLVGVGIVGIIGIQALINIGGVTGSIPITGVTLPFISYGGTSLLVSMASMGILLSISREHNRLEKEPQSRR